MDFRRSGFFLDVRGRWINRAVTPSAKRLQPNGVDVVLLPPHFSTHAGLLAYWPRTMPAVGIAPSMTRTPCYNKALSHLVGSVAYLAIVFVVSLGSRTPELGKMNMASRLAFPALNLPAVETNPPDAAPEFLLGGVLALWFQCEYKYRSPLIALHCIS